MRQHEYGSIAFIFEDISNLKASITLHRQLYLYDIEIKSLNMKLYFSYDLTRIIHQ